MVCPVSLLVTYLDLGVEREEIYCGLWLGLLSVTEGLEVGAMKFDGCMWLCGLRMFCFCWGDKKPNLHVAV